MMSKPLQREPRLFYVGLNLEERIPAEHPLRAVAQAIDFRFVRARVAHLYGVNGNESIDPTVLLKLMFLVFYEKVRSERDLMRQLPMRLDWLWFCQMDLDSEIPDHSVLSKARRRWGLAVFEAAFTHVLEQCVKAGLLEGTTAHADSTLLKADASVESRVPRALWEQLERGLDQGGDPQDQQEAKDQDAPPTRTPPPPQDTQAPELPPPPTGKFNAQSVSTTDPDAATTRRRGRGVVLGYRDHCLMDDKHGIVVATIAAPGDYDDGAMLVPLLDKWRAYLGEDPANDVGDGMYGTQENVARSRERGIRPYLKPRPTRHGSAGWLGRMPEECDPAVTLRLLKRRLHVAEGRFAEAHVRHDHRRCRWRRRWRVQIQCYLVGMVQNIKKLAKWMGRGAPRVAARVRGLGVRGLGVWDRVTRPIARAGAPAAALVP